MNDLETRTPCCGRKAKLPASSMSATQVCDRTCRKCRQRWHVIVRPAIPIKMGVANVVEWTEA